MKSAARAFAVAATLMATLIVAFACAPPASPGAAAPGSYYLTAPASDISDELGRVFRSVNQIEYSADYTTYVFPAEARMTEADVRAGGFEARADDSFAETLSKSGTATVVARSGTRLRMLTVNHVVRYPELRFQFFEPEPGAERAPRIVASASVRIRERGLLLGRGGPMGFAVRAHDDRHDLALIEVDLSDRSDVDRFPVLDLAAGNANRLSWGSFVYVLGFPRGYPMVTSAIVSNPDWDGQGSYITDGIWNEGLSGGLILAIRGGTGRLELVGLARASAAEREIVLRPDTSGLRPGMPSMRYEGPLWLETGLRVQYGIALPVSITTIAEFLRRQDLSLTRRD